MISHKTIFSSSTYKAYQKLIERPFGPKHFKAYQDSCSINILLFLFILMHKFSNLDYYEQDSCTLENSCASLHESFLNIHELLFYSKLCVTDYIVTLIWSCSFCILIAYFTIVHFTVYFFLLLQLFDFCLEYSNSGVWYLKLL